jgi:TonB family protein
LRPDDLLELFEIDPAETALGANAPREPHLAAVLFLVEFGEPDRFDPARATAVPERPLPPTGRRMPSFGMLGSLAIHLLPLLVLLDWSGTPAAITPPIPVQLVLEEPPPAPAKAPPPAPEKPPPGRLASEDMGEPAATPDQPTAAGAPAPPQTQTAAPPPPKPIPTPKLTSALPEPAPAPEPPLLPEEAEPTPHIKPPAKQAAARLPPNRHPAPRATQVPGPAATRDEYLAYCTALVRRYRGILPLSLVDGRHGATILAITVLDDGTIAHVAVKQSSGYRDIDARVEQMVAAVHKFPPLPQWIQAPRINLDLTMPFPEGLL